MSANLKYINGFELGAPKEIYENGENSWSFEEFRGTITTNSTVQTHQPIGKSAPYAGSYSMQLETTNHASHPGPDVKANLILDMSDGANGAGGRIVFSHYHEAGMWANINYGNADKQLFRIYDNGQSRSICQVRWRSDRKLDLYLNNSYQETTTITVPDATWVRLGVVFSLKDEGTHRRMGARLYINGTAATAWNQFYDTHDPTSGQMQFIWHGSHYTGSTFVDHIAVTSDDSIDITDGTTTSTGPYIDTETWLLLVPAIKPDADIGGFEAGNFTPSSGSDNFAVIDEAVFSSADYVQATTDPSSFGCTLSNLDGAYDANSVVKGV
jgi:hypothetical protein